MPNRIFRTFRKGQSLTKVRQIFSFPETPINRPIYKVDPHDCSIVNLLPNRKLNRRMSPRVCSNEIAGNLNTSTAIQFHSSQVGNVTIAATNTCKSGTIRRVKRNCISWPRLLSETKFYGSKTPNTIGKKD